MLRITTGTAKNKRLKSPDVEGYRGVQEVAKNSLFSIIGEAIVDSACLDLFAGSGNIGIEALSRGAKHCDFVDNHKYAERAVTENLKNCKLSDKAEFHLKDAVKYAANTENKYDFIFLDPFYHTTTHKFLMQNIEEILNPEGTVAFFHGKELDLKDLLEDIPLRIVDERRFGKSYFTILAKKDSLS